MPTEEELTEELNEILETNFEWHRLHEDDLREFHRMLKEGELVEPILKEFAKAQGTEQLEEKVDEWHLGKYALRLL